MPYMFSTANHDCFLFARFVRTAHPFFPMSSPQENQEESGKRGYAERMETNKPLLPPVPGLSVCKVILEAWKGGKCRKMWYCVCFSSFNTRGVSKGSSVSEQSANILYSINDVLGGFGLLQKRAEAHKVILRGSSLRHWCFFLGCLIVRNTGESGTWVYVRR